MSADPLGCLLLWVVFALILFGYALVGGEDDDRDTDELWLAGGGAADRADLGELPGRPEKVVADEP